MEQKKRILVVDDEPINLEFFDVMLTKLGFDVTMAENGQEALEAVRRLRPDLVILDNMMPKLTGWEVTKIIKSAPEYAEFSDTPIIMFSALDDVKDKVEGLELGADDYITKPFNFSEVLARIRTVIRSHELARQLASSENEAKRNAQTIESLQGTIANAIKVLKKAEGSDDIDAVKRTAAKASEVLQKANLAPNAARLT